VTPEKAAYMSQTRDQQHIAIAISEVAADWHASVVQQHIV